MNQTFKKLSVCVISLILCFHFVLVAVYCFPQDSSNGKMRSLISLYVYPIFHQNWGVFVPAPDVNRKLFVRYKTHDTFTDWEDILSKEVVRHKENRLSGNEARVLLLSNSLIYELNSLDEQSSGVFTTEQKNKEFVVLQFEVERYLRMEHKLLGSVGYELLLVSSGRNVTKAYYMKSLSRNYFEFYN